MLQAGVDKIEQLQAMVRRLTEAANARDEDVQLLAHHLCGVTEYHSSQSSPCSTASTSVLSLLPTATARGLSLLDSHHALYSSLFITGRCAMMLQEIGTRIILDGNESVPHTQTTFLPFSFLHWPPRLHLTSDLPPSILCSAARLISVSCFFSMNGWGRHEVLHQSPASRSHLVCTRRRRPRHEQQRQSSEHRAAAAEEREEWTATDECEWRPRPVIDQHPACLRLAQELAAGQRQSFTAQMRSLFKDGHVWEMTATCWVAKTEWTMEADGRSWERPTRAIIACGTDDAVIVEPL